MTQFILALCGIPASGKTVLAKAIKASFPSSRPLEIISTDDWRDDEFHFNFTPELENSVRKAALEKTWILVEKGVSIIHDDTNYYTSMRHELYEIALQYNCGFAVVYVSTPLSDAIRINESRDRPIPVEVLERINERLDIPGAKYAWDRPISSVNLLETTPIEAAKDIVLKLKGLQPARREKSSFELGLDERLDVTTRRIVNQFLRENPYFRGDPQVSRLRKEILRRAKLEELTHAEVGKELILRLEALIQGNS
ncbi:MAG: AAA family ATPase [Promethearchaeota archaeon]